MCAHMHVWKLEGTFLELVPAFHLYVGFRVQTQVQRFAQVLLYTEPSCRLSFQEAGFIERLETHKPQTQKAG